MILDLYSKKINNLLRKTNLTLSVAESCTGGLLSSLITKQQGASQFFDSGLIVYSNQAKMNLLNIPEAILDKYGAVSKETAILLANNIKEKRKTDIAISITGIAGPKSDNSKKPLGLVYIAINNQNNKSIVKKYNFSGSRKKIQKLTCKAAFILLFNNLK